MCLNFSVEGVGYGRQESCVQEKLFNRVPPVLGEFGKVCVVILPGTMALCSCWSIRPEAEVERSCLEEPAGHISHGWSMAAWWRSRRSLCVCTAPGRGSLQGPGLLFALEHTGSSCTWQSFVWSSSASQQRCRDSCLLSLSWQGRILRNGFYISWEQQKSLT